MPLSHYLSRIIALTELISQWRTYFHGLDRSRRLRVAHYATEIAATLSRAALWAEAIELDDGDVRAKRALYREMGRIQGYLETLFHVLSDHLDGRKLAGVKRRLKALSLTSDGAPLVSSQAAASARINQLVAAEGYFRALADGLRV